MLDVVIAIAAGALIGLSLGALGGGGSILAVPMLVYALGQSPAQATTGSLVVVGVTALTGSVAAHRAGNVLLGRGVVFGVVAVGGLNHSYLGTLPEDVAALRRTLTRRGGRRPSSCGPSQSGRASRGGRASRRSCWGALDLPGRGCMNGRSRCSG